MIDQNIPEFKKRIPGLIDQDLLDIISAVWKREKYHAQACDAEASAIFHIKLGLLLDELAIRQGRT